MPWTGQDVAGQRVRFVVRAVSRNQPFKQVCGLFGISRTTGYRWVSRYVEVGNLRDLKERSRRPHQVPNKTALEIERKVLALRDRVGWGAKRLAAVLRQKNIELAASTVHSILRRNKRIGIENPDWAAWMIQVLLADDPLPQLQREFPNALELSRLSHFISAGRLRERKKAMAVVAALKRIPVMVSAKCLQIHPRAVTRYFNRYRTGGTTELFRPRRAIHKKVDEQDRQFLFSVLHTPPSAYGINRTSWKMDDLHRILREAGHRMSHERIRRAIKAAGFRWRKAKVVLTSTDPDYRAKLDEIEKILSQLKEDEAFFSIDEFGPFAVKRKGGRKRVGPSEKYVVPQWQKSKGWTIISAALELSANQITHFYSFKKNTDEMIKMADLLREQYCARRTIYLSWDAASWHISKKLTSYLESINEHAAGDRRPIVKTAPLPACSQFLNVIESVFSGMARAIIHNSDYPSLAEAKHAIDRYFEERNEHFKKFPKRAGGKIWGLERVPSEFSEGHNCKDPRY
ncbi:MAG: IS630 family transposase [Candidatus Acidiferrales bacterium]